jgi:hypothetical protein
MYRKGEKTMKQINGLPINDCFLYYRNMVLDENIQDALDEFAELQEYTEYLKYTLQSNEETITELNEEICETVLNSIGLLNDALQFVSNKELSDEIIEQLEVLNGIKSRY